MRLGNFSVSLCVKDIAASRAFYEKHGFRVVHGDQKQNWLILQNETATIGLFQGMLERNTLTFNPGWNRIDAGIGMSMPRKWRYVSTSVPSAGTVILQSSRALAMRGSPRPASRAV